MRCHRLPLVRFLDKYERSLRLCWLFPVPCYQYVFVFISLRSPNLFQDIKDTLTVERGRSAGATFLRKMLKFVLTLANLPCLQNSPRLAKYRSHMLFCDTTLNPEHVVYLNAYQNFLIVAVKMLAYIRAWGINISKSSKFIFSAYTLLHLTSFFNQGVSRHNSSGEPLHVLDHAKSIHERIR